MIEGQTDGQRTDGHNLYNSYTGINPVLLSILINYQYWELIKTTVRTTEIRIHSSRLGGSPNLLYKP